ncbi:protein FAM227B-like [Dendronephthya gigantea]|uniref:protein FAM227B-like n=1 Tax=Dendronephthya gigantea TaxID=151771 RepID=UPI00106C37A3|nr:protein FAM227B-like [Dendronephthya gigantea]
MDRRIDAFLSDYAEQNGEELEEGEESEESSPLPKTADEWLARMGYVTWPIKLEEEDRLNLTPEDVGTGTLEDIINALAAHAPLDLSILDEVLKQIEELEKKVNFYASKIFNIEITPQQDEEVNDQNDQQADAEKKVVTPVALVRHYRSNDESNVLESARKSQEKEAQNRKAKTVENTTYFGFTPNELTPLPRNLESQQLLNKVTKIQNFPQPFRNVWKKAILSEASVAVFQDSFWWIFCQLFEPKQSKDVIFSRISDSFVALFFHIPTAYKDRFFHHYPDCLAQALYAGFCEAFPDSYKIFGNPFKATLTDTIFEWISGVRPRPMIWETWQLEELEPAGFQNSEEARKSLIPKTLSFDIDGILENERVSPSEKSKARSPSPGQSSETYKSHPAGSGPDFHKVQFNILGHSPLVLHFMRVKGVRETDLESVKKVVGRTEIARLPEPRPTYQDLINECKKNSQLLSQQYRLVLQMSAEESQHIQKQKRQVIAKINQMQVELTRKHSDFKTLSEKIYDLVLYSDYS